MKSFYKWFDVFFKWLFIGTIVCTILIWLILYYFGEKAFDLHNLLDVPITIQVTLLSLTFIFGILYVVTGTILFFIGNRKKKKNISYLGTILLLKGLRRTIIIFILAFFYFISIAA